MDTLQKDVVPPPAPSSSPLHHHTGFIIAIVITSVLLIIAAVLAYLSWDNGLKLARENISLLNAATELQTQNRNLQEQLTASVPTPFFYSEWLPELQDSVIHKVDPITKVDTILATVPDRSLSVFATPRVGYDGTIWLSESPIGDYDFASIAYHSFQVDGTGDALPVPFQSNLPPHPRAVALSPDETRLVSLYSDNQNSYANNAIVVWDLATGQATQIGTIAEGQSFAPIYVSDIMMAEGYSVQWSSNSCVATGVYRIQEDGSRAYDSSQVFCMP